MTGNPSRGEKAHFVCCFSFTKLLASLVFSCWTRTLDALASVLSRQGFQFVRIDGSLSLEQRRAAINRFQSEQDLKIMLLSSGSGSVG